MKIEIIEHKNFDRDFIIAVYDAMLQTITNRDFPFLENQSPMVYLNAEIRAEHIVELPDDLYPIKRKNPLDSILIMGKSIFDDKPRTLIIAVKGWKQAIPKHHCCCCKCSK